MTFRKVARTLQRRVRAFFDINQTLKRCCLYDSGIFVFFAKYGHRFLAITDKMEETLDKHSEGVIK